VATQLGDSYIAIVKEQTTGSSNNLESFERSLSEVNMSETELLSLGLGEGAAIGGEIHGSHNASGGFVGLDDLVEYFGIGRCGGEGEEFSCTTPSFEDFSVITSPEEPLQRRTFHTEDRWPI
jgi:hypothetical protein